MKTNLIIPLFFISHFIFAQINFTEELMVNATVLNMRNLPNLKGNVIEQLNDGEVIEFIEIASEEAEFIGDKKGFWLKVRLKNNTEGFVFSPYVVNSTILALEYDEFGRIPKLNWYAVYDDKTNYILQKVDLIKIQEDGWQLVKTNQNKNSEFIIGSINPLEERNIPKIGGAHINSYLTIGKNVQVYENSVKTEHDKLRYYFWVSGSYVLEDWGVRREKYNIYLVEKGFKTPSKKQEISQYFGNYGEIGIKIIWTGDIDGDDKPDFVLGEATTQGGTYYLLLSSEAKNNELIKLVSAYGSASKC